MYSRRVYCTNIKFDDSKIGKLELDCTSVHLKVYLNVPDEVIDINIFRQFLFGNFVINRAMQIVRYVN